MLTSQSVTAVVSRQFMLICERDEEGFPQDAEVYEQNSEEIITCSLMFVERV